MWDGILSFGDGLILSALLVPFFGWIIRRGLNIRKNQKEKKQLLTCSIKKTAIKFLIGAVGVVLAAKLAIIPSGINIAKYLGIPEIVIGISMIAIGTSLPELVTAMIASFKKMEDLAAGNVIGANILNILWVLGVSSVIKPLAIDLTTKFVTMPLVIFFALLVFLFVRTKLKLTRNHGLMFLLLYAGYLFYIVKFAYA